MIGGRSAMREVLLGLAFAFIVGPFAYVLAGAAGAAAWGLLAERFGRCSDQYAWIEGCLSAGHYAGLVGVVACGVWRAKSSLSAGPPASQPPDRTGPDA